MAHFFVENPHLHELGHGIDDPVLSHPLPLVQLALDAPIPVGRGGREDLDNEVRRSSDPAIGQNLPPLV